METQLDHKRLHEDETPPEPGSFEQLIQEHPIPMWIYDLKTLAFLEVNAAAVEKYGYTRQEFLQMNLSDIGPRADAAGQPGTAARKRPGPRQTGGLVHRLKDGSLIDVETTSQTLEFRGRSAVLMVTRDVSEHHRTALALDEGEERFRLMLETAPYAVVLIDTEGRFVFANRAARQLTGAGKTANLLGKHYSTLLPPGMVDKGAEQVQLLFQGHVLDKPVETMLLRLDGKRIPVEISATQFPYQGRMSIQVIAQDLSWRRGIERALKESEDRFGKALEHIPDSVVIYDRHMRVKYANAAAREFSGHSEAELLGKREDEVWPEKIYKVSMPALRRAFITRAKVSLETSFHFAHGGKRSVAVTYQPILDEEGQVAEMVGILHDFTHRQRITETLQERLDELETIHTVSVALRKARTREEALPILMDETLAALGTDSGSISLHHPESDDLLPVVDRGWFARLDRSGPRTGSSIAMRVFRSGRTHVTDDFRTDPYTRESLRDQMPPGWGGVVLPIRTGSDTVGVIYISVPASKRLSQEQVKLLESLAEMAGTTLHRLRLYEEALKRLEQLKALQNIDQAITTTVDLKVTLAIITEQVVGQLKVDAASILLLNPHTRNLEFGAGSGFRTDLIRTALVKEGESLAGRVALARTPLEMHDVDVEGTDAQLAEFWRQESFSFYYAVPLIAKGQVKGVLEVFQCRPFQTNPEWTDFLDALAQQAAIAIDNAQLFNNLKHANLELALAYDSTIEGWSRALDLRDKETEGHTRRVTELTLELARAMGVPEVELVHIRRGALLHDIGKLGVPDEILLKPGPLSEQEWKLMRTHPQLAYEMLSPIAYLHPALDIPYCHHERWDGSGYPHGLAGIEIPQAARMFAVVDVWDALRSERPYRKAWSEEDALAYLKEQAGREFDPQVVETFLKVLKRQK